MAYLARTDAVERREDPSLTLPGVRSIVVVADAYDAGEGSGARGEPASRDPSTGVIARYARGADYHRVLRGKLDRLRLWTQERLEHDGRVGRVYVDTGPLLERELGRRAGLGWFGRNIMLIHPRRGSYFFLGALLLEVSLPPDPPFTDDRCGSCRACLDACPKGALLGRDETGAPVMDARRCISYLTIELRGPIPRDLRPAIGNRIFGCDICQEVCPWNQRFPEHASLESRYAARGPGELPAGVEALPGDAPITAAAPVDAEVAPGSSGAEPTRGIPVRGTVTHRASRNRARPGCLGYLLSLLGHPQARSRRLRAQRLHRARQLGGSPGGRGARRSAPGQRVGRARACGVGAGTNRRSASAGGAVRKALGGVGRSGVGGVAGGL